MKNFGKGIGLFLLVVALSVLSIAVTPGFLAASYTPNPVSIAPPTGNGVYFAGWSNTCSGGATVAVALQAGFASRTLSSSDSFSCTDVGSVTEMPASGPVANYAVTLPIPSTLGVTNPYFTAENFNAAYNIAITPGAGWTLNGSSSAVNVPPLSVGFIHVDSVISDNYIMRITPLSASGGSAFDGGSGSSYQDVGSISVPSDPASNYVRLFQNSNTLSCITSTGAYCPAQFGSLTLTAQYSWTLGNGTTVGFVQAESGSGSSNTAPGYYEAAASPTNAYDSFLYPCQQAGNWCESSSTPSADSNATLAVNNPARALTSSGPLVQTDIDGLVTMNSTSGQSIALQCPSTPNFMAGWRTQIMNLGVGTLTLTASGCSINGITSLAQNASVQIVSDGTNLNVLSGSGSSGGGTTTNAVTFNNGGSGAASGTSFNGAAAETISYNTVGALGATATAGGDLSGSYPSPTVAQIEGAAIPASAAVAGTNSSSQIVAATAHNEVTPYKCADSSGSGTAQSCSTSPSFTPVSGDTIWYTTTTTNSGTGLTVNVNSLGAKSIAIPGSSGWTTTLTASIIPANTPLILVYTGTNWDVVQTGTASAGGGYSPSTFSQTGINFGSSTGDGTVYTIFTAPSAGLYEVHATFIVTTLQSGCSTSGVGSGRVKWTDQETSTTQNDTTGLSESALGSVTYFTYLANLASGGTVTMDLDTTTAPAGCSTSQVFSIHALVLPN